MAHLQRIFTSRLLTLRAPALQQSYSPYSVGVIGAPFWNGQSKPGTDQGPDSLRGHGLLSKLNLIHDNVVDFGNLHFGLAHVLASEMIDSSVRLSNKNEFMLSQMCSQLSHFVQNSVDKGFVPLILGGDHSIAVGSVLGTCNAEKYRDKDISLIWIDAHADLNTERSSKSGNLHGMPVSFLIKNIDAPRRHLFHNFKPCLHSHNVVYIGLRDVEIAELEILKQMNVSYFSMREIDKLGIENVMARALDIINPTGQNKIHVSFDVDSVDDSFIISTGTPVLGGLTVREAINIAEIIDNTGQMVALDVVELNPKIGTSEQVAQSAKYIIDIVLAFFGKSRLGCYHKSAER